MAALDISVSGPESIIIQAISQIIVALIESRATMSPEARNEQDRILAQMYWDLRSLLERAKIVGEKKQ